MVETGIFDPSAGSWPDGRVRLLAPRTPTTCCVEIAAGGQLGRVEGDRQARLETARQVGPGDAFDRRDLGDDLGPGDRRDLVEAVRARSRRSTR